ncbi:hypothetical protein SLEP1_g31572 [Rubroshorea leprosula]|uniref:BED-type domain-containing protein n=1 Tax=Rubroshorea leprosula TaxID=152421 RepID=A0AAV5KB94_9ROSI|nr:hypothetical protein SLEP1_g31572 [Rubroshorea leprosula]
MAFWVSNHVCKWRNYNRLGMETRSMSSAHFQKHLISTKKSFRKNIGAYVYCLYGMEKDPALPPKQHLIDARVIYSLAPALGHNQLALLRDSWLWALEFTQVTLLLCYSTLGCVSPEQESRGATCSQDMENSESIEKSKETNSSTIAVRDNATKNMTDGSTYAKSDKANSDAGATGAGPSLSVQRKPMKRRTWVWQFFDEFINENGKTRTRCHFCGYDLAAKSSTNGTTPLKNHYNSCKLNLVNLKTQQTLLNFQKVLKVNDVDGKEVTQLTTTSRKFDEQAIKKALVEMLIVDEFPFSFVEHSGFIKFCQVAWALFNIPSRDMLERWLREWGIAKVYCVTLVNASANDVLVRHLKGCLQKWGTSILGGKDLHMRCAAHIINFVVNDGFKEMQPSVTTIRGVVRYVRQSPMRQKLFFECAKFEKI